MSRPNILLITTDQQRFDTIAALGNKHIYTPHLNWLVDEGITFTRCYADCPICMPSRATIMTGKMGTTLGLVENKDEIMPMAAHDTLPAILTRNGYQTRAQGKMHFSPMRANYGFEHMELPMDYYIERNRDIKGGIPKAHGVGENELEPVISTVDELNSLTYWTVRRSIDFIETRDDTRPFFLWTSFTKPHPPLDPCANYWALYRNNEIPPPIWGGWSEQVENMPQGYLKPTYSLNSAYRMTKEQLQESKRAYYACITQIDYNLGLLFGRMREMGLLDNTWIIFTSDHGDMMGDHHMGAKSMFFEGSAHIPMLIRPPQAAWEINPLAGEKCDALVNLTDVLPTILSAAGISLPEDIDGIDMIDLMRNSTEDRIFYGNFNHTHFAVIENEYKYLWTSLGGDELFFNLENDPYEQHNLVVLPEQQQRLNGMREKLIAYLEKNEPSLVKDGELVHQPAPKGPMDIAKWPGFHSTSANSDVLH